MLIDQVILFEVFKRIRQQRDLDAALYAVAHMQRGRVIDLDAQDNGPLKMQRTPGPCVAILGILGIGLSGWISCVKQSAGGASRSEPTEGDRLGRYRGAWVHEDTRTSGGGLMLAYTHGDIPPPELDIPFSNEVLIHAERLRLGVEDSLFVMSG